WDSYSYEACAPSDYPSYRDLAYDCSSIEPSAGSRQLRPARGTGGREPARSHYSPGRYKGRKALKIEFTDAANKGPPGVDLLFDMPTFVLIPGKFKNGTIEVDILGRLNGKGLPDARAFVGLAYRVFDGGARFESIYLRPLNGRKTNPLSPRDKRAIQYFAYPDWKFDRL